MPRDEKLDHLKRVPLFEKLGTAELERLGKLETTRIPWGIGMGRPAFVTARLMETWAHGLDVHAAVGERLVAALEATDLRVEGRPVPLAISVGVAPFGGGDSLDAKRLLALADKAMYVVKAGGGGGSLEAPAAARELGTEPA